MSLKIAMAAVTDDTTCVNVSAGGVVHSLNVTPDLRVGELKALLRPLTVGASSARLIFKGKERRDTDVLRDVGLVGGARAMLLFATGSARAPPNEQPVAGVDPAPRVGRAAAASTAPAADAPGADAACLCEAGPDHPALDDGLSINVACLGEVGAVCAPPDGVVRDLKLRIAARFGVPVGQQRLIHRGKVLQDAALLSALGLKPGAKMAVSCTEGFHLEAEGAKAVQGMARTALTLEARLASIQRKQKHRMADGDELLAALGVLDEEARAAELDLSNASVKPAIDVQRRELLERVQRLLETTRRIRKDLRP